MPNNNDIAIVVDHVSKDFILPHEKTTSVKSGLINAYRSGKKTKEVQHALKDINFEVKKGEFFGIVGRNGSGKSTLLKILAQIYQPTKGKVKINGKLVPFIELGVGFNPELTGRENVFLNGALLGFTRKEMESMYDEIVDFAELERFMDQKLKNYSSGMQVRLAFSIAIRAKSDILVLDEVLAVGDEAFQRKCYQYFAEIKRQKQTVILVSHNMDVVQQYCSRGILIDKDHKPFIGSPLRITQIYRELNEQEGITVNSKPNNSSPGTKYIEASVDFNNLGDELKFDILLKPKVNLDEPIVALEIFKDDGEPIIRWVTDERIENPIDLNEKDKVKISVYMQNIFPVGRFNVRLLIRKRDRSLDYGVFNDIVKFEVKNATEYIHNTLWRPVERANVIKIK